MDLTNLSSAQKDELMDQVKQQVAIANTQEFISVSASPFFVDVTSHISYHASSSIAESHR